MKTNDRNLLAENLRKYYTKLGYEVGEIKIYNTEKDGTVVNVTVKPPQAINFILTEIQLSDL